MKRKRENLVLRRIFKRGVWVLKKDFNFKRDIWSNWCLRTTYPYVVNERRQISFGFVCSKLLANYFIHSLYYYECHSC